MKIRAFLRTRGIALNGQGTGHQKNAKGGKEAGHDETRPWQTTFAARLKFDQEPASESMSIARVTS